MKPRARTKAAGSCGAPERQEEPNHGGHRIHEGSRSEAGYGDKEKDKEDRKIDEEDQKVIVRSNGTVGYVGKDIAYHMWKFGLLGRDFSYRKFYRYPNGHDCWISTTPDDPEAAKDHPHFGDVAEIYNVIDARQSEAQNTVIEALRGLGHGEAADRYTHFSYEMVALTPRCAAELGYELSEEEKARPWIEVSGRKGFGVKADDLLDALITSARKEVDSRHPELSETERGVISTQIAIGALRYFMLKFTKPSVIAFDFKDALSFEGETGPYAQYAVVRATNIFRKRRLDPEDISCRPRPGNADCSLPRISPSTSRRTRQRHLGALAGRSQDFLYYRPVHCDHRARLSGQARLSARSAFQHFLPSASHPRRAGREPKAVSANHRRGRSP